MYNCHRIVTLRIAFIDAKGKHTHYIAVIEDIEERKAAEEYIKKFINKKENSQEE